MMRSIQIVAIVLLSVVSILVAAQGTAQKVTIYSWPMSASKPSELAQLEYSEASTGFRSSISNFSPPTLASEGAPSTTKELVRIGLYDPATKGWQGVVTAANSFDPKYQQKITLHMDPDHQPWHIGFSAYTKPSPTQKMRRKGEEPEVIPQVISEVIIPSPAPTPHLNKPVVLSPEGKVDDKPEEKTFLQK